MNSSPTTLHAKGLRKDYGSGEGLVRALDGVDLEVTRGEILAIMGPSGCGKSTLLQLIGGLDRPSSGELSVAGRRLDQLSERALAHLRRDEIGFVFQAFHLMDELTAQENVEFPALLAGCRPAMLVHAPPPSLRRSIWWIAPGIFPRCCPGGNANELRSREH